MMWIDHLKEEAEILAKEIAEERAQAMAEERAQKMAEERAQKMAEERAKNMAQNLAKDLVNSSIQQTRLDTAQKMFADGLDPELIFKYTNIPVEQLK